MNVAANAARALTSCARASRLGFSTRSTVLRTSTLGWRSSAIRSNSADASAGRPWVASTMTQMTSASPAPLHALATMARASRRRGANSPGVSTRMICALPSTAMPRSRARVVCAFGVTIATLWPTSALTRVDLPTLVAPIRAANPQRVVSSIGRRGPGRHGRGLDPFACEQHRRRGLLGGALGTADAFGGRQVRQFDADAELQIVMRAAAPDFPVERGRQPASLRPFLQRGLGVARRARAHSQALAPQPLHQQGGDRVASVQNPRPDQRLAHIGEDRGAATAAGVGFRTAELDGFAEIN